MERLKPICTAELNAVLDKLPKAIVEEVEDTREVFRDDKERYKAGRITFEAYRKWRDETRRETEGFCLALELYGALTTVEARVLRRYMRGNKTDKEVAE